MKIENPLDAFNTYSVHYVMLACRTTVVAQQFASDDDKAMATSLAAIDAVRALGDPVVLGGNANDVFLMLDTRRFSQFTVESLKYDVLINGLQRGASTSNLAVDLSMTILDSAGISFANFMQWLMDTQMKCNYDGLIFMLRTIFVGHKPDGTSETVQSETIPMHLNKMEINLDFAKGAYNLEFMPNMNFDVNRYNRWLTVWLATTYHTGKGNKLGALITSFEKELNTKSADFFNGVQNTLAAVNGGAKVQTLGRKVQYMITLPSKDWANFDVTGATPGGAPEIKFFADLPKKDEKTGTTSGQIKDSTTAVKPSLTIPKALDAIFKQCPDVAKLGNFKTNTNTSDEYVTFFKYIVGITSDNDIVMVHVDVVEFKVPNIIAQEQPKNKNTSIVTQQENEFYVTTDLGNGVIKREPRNFIEYDYIFTGMNKDILNFDMKIQDFQFLLASNMRIGDDAMRNVTDRSGDTNQPKPAPGSDELIYTRQYDPIIMPTDTEAALKNFSSYSLLLKTKEQAQELKDQRQKYTKNLSTFYAGSPITVALTIRGNPLIMHKFNMGKLLKHVKSAPGSQSVEITGKDRIEYRNNLENEILRQNPGSFDKQGGSFVYKNSNLDSKSYAISPVFCKVNIMGPNVDFRTGAPITDENGVTTYATSVLSDNYYVVFKLTNIFQGHDFKQELELYAHNLFGSNKIQKDYSGVNAGTVGGVQTNVQ